MNPSKNNESASFPRQCGLCGRPLEGNGNGNHGTHPTCCSNCSRVERSFQGLGLGLGLDPLELPEAPGTSQTQGLGQRENVRQNAGSSVPAGYLLEAPPAEEENPDVNSSESPLSEVSDSELLKGSPWAGGIGQRDETKLPSEEPSSSSGSDIPFSRPSGPKTPSPIPQETQKRGPKRRACEECRNKRRKCTHLQMEDVPGSATGKRKNEDDDAGPSKKRNRRSEPAKPTSKPKANGKGRKRKAGEEVLNHTSDEAMLPVYTSYCEKMQKQVKALEKDLGKTFIHVQDMTGLMQTSVWEAMQMVEKMKEARETLNDWKQACLSRR